LKLIQESPDLYDGYLIGQPLISAPWVGTSALYTQIVMKTELGYTAANKAEAAAFAKKVDGANRRAVAQCDKAGLDYLLDPFSCDYDPTRDAAMLCSGVAGNGVIGSNGDAENCMSLKEATALNKIWYGPTSDGSWDPSQSVESRSGKSLGAKQTWWTFTKSTAIGGRMCATPPTRAPPRRSRSPTPQRRCATSGWSSTTPGWPRRRANSSPRKPRSSASTAPTWPTCASCAI
jgi:feruloyl esterase